MNAYGSEDWRDFAVGVSGASAALVGLLFVAISINLRSIVTSYGLPGRAVHALVLLATPVFISMAVLVPQPGVLLGIELLVLATITVPTLAWHSNPHHRPPDTPAIGWAVGVVTPTAALTIGLLVSGIGLITTTLGGIYWLPPAIAVALGDRDVLLDGEDRCESGPLLVDEQFESAGCARPGRARLIRSVERASPALGPPGDGLCGLPTNLPGQQP